MQVQRVTMPGARSESWTVLGGEGAPVEPVERFLAHLSAIERSPNTVKAYAHDLKDYFEYVHGRGLDWRSISLEEVGGFVVWLRLPASGRAGLVAVLPSVAPQIAASSVNRKLSAVTAFYRFHARHGVHVAELLTVRGVGGRGGFKPFLHHVAKNEPVRRRAIGLKTPVKLPRVMTPGEVQAILDACGHLRDRLLIAVLYETGMRIGEALGLRHEDIAAAERQISIVARENENGVRTKSPRGRGIPVAAGLIRLYADYLHREYRELDSDYVFVNLFAAPVGHAMTYRAAYDLVQRLRRRTGIDFDPHWLRHTAATRMLREKVPIEVVARLLGHSSPVTTHQVYGHLTAEDARRALEDAAWFQGREVAL